MKQNITRRKVSTSKYKTIDGENWESIARENKISSQELRNENPEIGNLTAGKKIQIPHFEECGEIITIRPNDIRELSEYGLNEIYNEVHGYSDCPETLKVILLANFDENNKKRDLELLRGMLLSINSLSQSGKKLAFKTIDLSRVNPDNVADVLKMESPDILFTTFDKDFPKTLTEFGDNPKKWIVNIFDAKADDWLAHCNIVNVMSPSEMFNAISADYLLPTFSQFAKYVFDPDETRDTDQVSSLIFDRIDDENKIPLSDMSDISNFKYQAGETYVFVPTVTKKSEIASFLKTISEVIENNPMTTFAVIGKPSWIVYSEIFEKQFSKCNTYIPSRFVINNDNQDVKDFNSAFVSTYNESPIRSFPGYALMGYDVAQFFINNYFKNKGDLNYWDDSLISPLQMNIREKRITNRSGLYNNSIYMLHYNDEGLKIVTL